MKKVILVDDEDAGRTLIRQYLQHFPEMIIVGEANNGVDALDLINRFKPDILFLDIQMPGLSGFDVIKLLEEIPLTVFSTAFDKYALQAFEVHAVDYLLKPYTLERFKTCMQKLNSNAGSNNVQTLAESLINPQTYPDKILVQKAQRLIAVSISDIIRIEAEGDYSNLITTTANHLSNFGISALESRLSPSNFIRVHRSSMVNISYIKEVHKYSHSFDIVMQNGDVVKVSRSYMDSIKKFIF